MNEEPQEEIEIALALSDETSGRRFANESLQFVLQEGFVFHTHGDDAQQEERRALAEDLDLHIGGHHDEGELGHFLGPELVHKLISLA